MFCSINGLLLILVELNQGCPKSTCSYRHGLVGTDLWVEWMDDQTYLITHRCHGPLLNVEQLSISLNMWLDNPSAMDLSTSAF